MAGKNHTSNQYGLWVLLFLYMLVTEKKELELYVTTELRKRPETTHISQVFEILTFEQFLDVFSALR